MFMRAGLSVARRFHGQSLQGMLIVNVINFKGSKTSDSIGFKLLYFRLGVFCTESSAVVVLHFCFFVFIEST